MSSWDETKHRRGGDGRFASQGPAAEAGVSLDQDDTEQVIAAGMEARFGYLADDPPDSRQVRRDRSLLAGIEAGRLPRWTVLTPSPDQVESLAQARARRKESFSAYRSHADEVNSRLPSRQGAILTGGGVSVDRRAKQAAFAADRMATAERLRAQLDELGPMTRGEPMARIAKRVLARNTLDGVLAECRGEPSIWVPQYSEDDARDNDALFEVYWAEAQAERDARWQMGWPGPGPAPEGPRTVRFL